MNSLYSVLMASLLFAFFDHSHSLAAIKKPDVAVEVAKIAEVTKSLSFPSLTKSQKQSTLLAETSGVIRKIKKQLGQLVLSGETLALIENPDPVYQYKPFAVKSPISGRLTKSQVLEGGLVERGTPLFTVTDPHSVVVEVQVPARDLSYLRIGALAHLTENGQSKELKLVGYSPTPDQGTLTSLAIFEFTNPKDTGVPGLQGTVEYVASSRNIILLPESTLVRKNGKVYIRKFVDGKMKLAEVALGDRYEDQMEILTGLSSGEEFISRTSQHIKDGEEVQKISKKGDSDSQTTSESQSQ